jgi:hypothetical protein
MLRCTRVLDFVEQVVLVAIDAIVQTIQRICRTIVEQIEEWEQRWEEQCETVQRKVCKWLPWPLNKLCEWVTETVCQLVEVLVRIVKTVVRTVCEIVVGFIKITILIPMTIIVSVLRVVCFIVDVIINWVKIIVAAIVGIPEFLTCLLGLRLRKHLHACVTVLAGRDGQPVVDAAQVDAVLQEAARILSVRFNTRLHIHGRKLVRVPDNRLDVNACDASQLFSAEALDLTGEAERSGTFGELFGCGDDLLDLAGELIHDVLNIIFIRNIVEGDDIGCHIPGTNYVIVDRTAGGLTLAHEIGHAGDLWHVSDTNNLMNHVTIGDQVHDWQVCIFRRSRFVVYAP